jgi:hypothetical protein
VKWRRSTVATRVMPKRSAVAITAGLIPAPASRNISGSVKTASLWWPGRCRPSGAGCPPGGALLALSQPMTLTDRLTAGL